MVTYNLPVGSPLIRAIRDSNFGLLVFKGKDLQEWYFSELNPDYLGMGPAVAGDPGARRAGDISYVAEFLDCVDGLGAMGNGAHAPGETVDLKSFPFFIKRSALLMYRLTSGK